MAASVLWALVAAALWIASHARPGIWRLGGESVLPSAVESRYLPQQTTDPKTGVARTSFTFTDEPEAVSWGEWFAENRRGRIVLVGQRYEEDSVRVAAGAGPFESVEVRPSAMTPRMLRARIELRTAASFTVGFNVSAQRDLTYGLQWWERLGVGWEREIIPATPLRVATAASPNGLPSKYVAGGPASRAVQAMVPHWLLLLLGFPLPAVAYARWQRTRGRRRRGECLACGYDRRATPGGDPCPECGTVPDAQ